MKLLSLFVTLLGVYVCSADYSPLSYVDRQCGEDLSNLWLDVVAVVDNSQGMTDDGLNNVAANILTVFSNGTRIGSNTFEPRTTRLGLVTYNNVATQRADLNQYKSIGDAYNGVFDALSTTVDTTESYLATGLTLAENMLLEQSANSTRAHYKRVVIVYASEYKGDGELDPLPVASRLKLNDVYIITVAYEQSGDDGLLKGLSQIASPGFSFSNDDHQSGNLVGKIQSSLLQSNCFCPSDWIQYRTSYSDPASYRYGVCIQPVNINSNWLAAKISCGRRWNVSSLATEFNQAKHDFILSAVKKANGFAPPYKYQIGLNYVSGSWVWDQPAGRQQVPLQKPFMWLSNNPQSASDQSAAMNMQSGQGTGWMSIATMVGSANYVCETYSCDTDNYCDAQFFKTK
ncbi:hypothetical protein GCK72_003277 [Caenorhabditis remanei]|uniref:VWFA domain-containing protein n=1 Tax=Caenorhabditis remanei TaxID=31234 RepID=A0A6A5HW33_CAERE|nr:hypothetical protein GCK72_003276 [Caenorhabditis remanei]XP_053592585.1 hypothetical protein GCK72_003277 [Caenorhabditis remanei]KAF1771450.1 hypothetical protein GCK72_003276 [Caenorhabditis remanei]KAF1771451.1 hypothetical protein GCK72_003277 [Caenorhabditis remanei]